MAGLRKSIEGFEKLDDYLRGRSTATAKRAKAARCVVAGLHLELKLNKACRKVKLEKSCS